MDVRRVVTGHDADGKAVFVSDERVSPVATSLVPGNEFHRLEPAVLAVLICGAHHDRVG